MNRHMIGQSGAGAVRRHVPIDLCAEVQGVGWGFTDAVSDALANAASRGKNGEYPRFHF
jgi:hypothetical protein